MALPAKSDKQFTEITARNPPATQYAVPMFNTFGSSIHLFTPRRALQRLHRVLHRKLRTNCEVKGHTHPGMVQYWSSRSFLLPWSSYPLLPPQSFLQPCLHDHRINVTADGSINRREKVFFIYVGRLGRRSVFAGCVIMWAKCLEKQLLAKFASS